jgi:hypothetical protein
MLVMNLLLARSNTDNTRSLCGDDVPKPGVRDDGSQGMDAINSGNCDESLLVSP